jgi:hypothetical protein
MNHKGLPTNVYSLRQSEFGIIPGSPWVYWVSDSIRSAFSKLISLDKVAQPKAGTGTGNNIRFLRFWWEIGKAKIKRDCKDSLEAKQAKEKWYPYMKGGKRCKWYGNQEYVITWKNNAEELSSYDRAVIRNESFYFREGITWTDLGTKGFSARISPGGFVYDVSGSCFFSNNYENLSYLMGLVNGEPINYLLNLINPTIHFQVGDISRLPIPLKRNSNFEKMVFYATWISKLISAIDETTYDFVVPPFKFEFNDIKEKLDSFENEIDKTVYSYYNFSKEDQILIKDELFVNSSAIVDEESENGTEQPILESIETNFISQLFYIIGVILGRFQPGTPGALGSAIYRRTDFAIGSLPEPTEEEFNELVGEPSQFAYVDEQGGRHVFSRQVEDALRKLALPDGIAVFDPNPPRDLPTLVSKALELMLGQAQAQEVIQQAAGGDLRKYLEKDFFTQHHIKQYRKRPVYWPIQSSKRSYGFVLFHEKIDRNTFYALQQEPYLPTKRRAVQLRLEELGKKVLTVQGAARKPIEKEMDELRQLGEELAQFAKDLDAITRGGYEPEADWIDDGVILRMAPLWSVIPLWKSEPKKYWDELAAGKYDWSRIAMKYWPERVKQACKKNKSYAIAHGHEEWYAGK